MTQLPIHAFAPQNEKSMVGALYDPETGAIVHIHMTSVDEGGTLPDRAAFEKEALDYLARYVDKGKPRQGKLSFLHIDPQHFRARVRYHVDVKNNALIEVPHKPR
jgi:hypothetical protein